MDQSQTPGYERWNVASCHFHTHTYHHLNANLVHPPLNRVQDSESHPLLDRRHSILRRGTPSRRFDDTKNGSIRNTLITATDVRVRVGSHSELELHLREGGSEPVIKTFICHTRTQIHTVNVDGLWTTYRDRWECKGTGEAEGLSIYT